MNTGDIEEKELIDLLAGSKTKKPSRDFSIRLTELLIAKYHKKRVQKSSFEKHFGKFVLFFLVCSNVLIFYDLSLFSAEPLFFICAAFFVIGVGLLLVLMGRFRNQSFFA